MLQKLLSGIDALIQLDSRGRLRVEDYAKFFSSQYPDDVRYAVCIHLCKKPDLEYALAVALRTTLETLLAKCTSHRKLDNIPLLYNLFEITLCVSSPVTFEQETCCVEQPKPSLSGTGVVVRCCEAVKYIQGARVRFIFCLASVKIPY